MTLYDGTEVVTHTITHGETLTSIAQKYRFQPPGNWKPILYYNTKVHNVLGNNPNQIRTGDTIFIPRSKQGYEALIRKLRELKTDLTIHGINVQGELERDLLQHKASRVLFDLTGDIATTIGTIALKAAQVSNAMKQASTMVGRGIPAAEYLARKEAKKLSQHLTKELADKTISAALTAVDKNAADLYKDGKTVKKGIDGIRGVSLQGGKSLLDIADIMLSYMTVSNVADAYIWLSVGETTEQTFKGIMANVKKTVSSGERTMEEKIAKYRREKALVYPV